MSDYDTDFYTWTQQQAQALRAQDWAAVDVNHVAEEIEDLWKSADHDLTGLLLGFLELIYRPCPEDVGQYYWQASVIDYHRGMLADWLEGSPHLRPVLVGLLAEDYAWARQQVMGRRTPPLTEPPERCPWSLDQLLDEHWWPPEAPARLP
jgi:Domain of unknown function DUF29